MDKTKIKEFARVYGIVVVMCLIGTWAVFAILPNKSGADNSIASLRQQQAELDQSIIELKPKYESQRLIYEKAQQEMTKIETEAKEYREKIQTLQNSIESVREGKKE